MTTLPYWRIAEMRAMAAKRRARPKRDILLVQSALANLRLRYMMEVSFWNPAHTGKQGNLNGGYQWIDIVAIYRDLDGKQRRLPILVDRPSKRWKGYEKHAWQVKQDYLKPYGLLVLPIGMSSQEYQILIFRHIKKLQTQGRSAAQTVKELGF